MQNYKLSVKLHLAFHTVCQIIQLNDKFFAFYLEKFTPGRTNLHRRRLWRLWQISGMDLSSFGDIDYGERLSNKGTQKGQTDNVSCDIFVRLWRLMFGKDTTGKNAIWMMMTLNLSELLLWITVRIAHLRIAFQWAILMWSMLSPSVIGIAHLNYYVLMHCTMFKLKNGVKSSQFWQIIFPPIFNENLPNFKR